MFLVNLKWSLFSFCSSVFILFIFFSILFCYFIFPFLFSLSSFLDACLFSNEKEREKGGYGYG